MSWSEPKLQGRVCASVGPAAEARRGDVMARGFVDAADSAAWFVAVEHQEFQCGGVNAHAVNDRVPMDMHPDLAPPRPRCARGDVEPRRLPEPCLKGEDVGFLGAPVPPWRVHDGARGRCEGEERQPEESAHAPEIIAERASPQPSSQSCPGARWMRASVGDVLPLAPRQPLRVELSPSGVSSPPTTARKSRPGFKPPGNPQRAATRSPL